MSKSPLVYTKQSDVIKFVRTFGEALAVEHNSSLISYDANIDADTLKKFDVLENSVGKTLKIYFRKHGTFTNINNDPSYNIEFWSARNEIVGILNIEIESINRYNIYYEKYE